MIAIQHYLNLYIMLMSIPPYFLVVFTKQENLLAHRADPTTSKSEVEGPRF